MDLGDFFTGETTHNLWLLAGLMGLFLGMTIGEPGIAAIGLAAIITAIAALSVPTVSIQLAIWAILSLCLAIVMRGMVPRESSEIKPQTDATVTRTIPSGQIGEVSYEGSIWKARCQISDVAIAPGQAVQVVGRQGNTLIVLPSPFWSDVQY